MMEIKINLVGDSANTYSSNAELSIDASNKYLYVKLNDPEREITFDIKELNKIIRVLTDD